MNEMAFPGNIVADRIPAMRQTFSPEKKQKKMVPCRISFQGAGDLREIYKRKRVSSRRSGGFFHVFQRKKVCSSVICLRRRSAGRFHGEKSPFKGRSLFPPLSNLKEMHALHTPSRIQKDFRETSETFSGGSPGPETFHVGPLHPSFIRSDAHSDPVQTPLLDFDFLPHVGDDVDRGKRRMPPA